MGGGEGGGREGPERERDREEEREVRRERDRERTGSGITAGEKETGRDRQAGSQGRTDKRGGDRDRQTNFWDREAAN